VSLSNGGSLVAGRVTDASSAPERGPQGGVEGHSRSMVG
jgi:hypothetical protein